MGGFSEHRRRGCFISVVVTPRARLGYSTRGGNVELRAVQPRCYCLRAGGYFLRAEDQYCGALMHALQGLIPCVIH